jgi:hypothetical protein
MKTTKFWMPTLNWWLVANFLTRRPKELPQQTMQILGTHIDKYMNKSAQQNNEKLSNNNRNRPIKDSRSACLVCRLTVVHNSWSFGHWINESPAKLISQFDFEDLSERVARERPALCTLSQHRPYELTMLNWNLDSCCGMVEMTGPYRCIHKESKFQASISTFTITI